MSPESGRARAQLAYDNERRLTAWQNAPSAPTSTDAFAYDGEGNRVAAGRQWHDHLLPCGTGGGDRRSAHQVPHRARGGDRRAAGQRDRHAHASSASDGLGSVQTALDSGGSVTARQLFLPYGGGRYSSGVMPTAKAFTGQRQDATTSLDYYNARYYDAALGQFASADCGGKGGLNRYTYVLGNPETATDPSGHMIYGDHALDAPGKNGSHRALKKRWVKVAIKLTSMTRPTTASMAANAAIASPRLWTGWKNPRP